MTFSCKFTESFQTDAIDDVVQLNSAIRFTVHQKFKSMASVQSQTENVSIIYGSGVNYRCIIITMY